jgi:hypothetical protein
MFRSVQKKLLGNGALHVAQEANLCRKGNLVWRRNEMWGVSVGVMGLKLNRARAGVRFTQPAG